MPQSHHQAVLHMSNRITYSLRQADATKPSPSSPAHVKQNHLLATHGQMPQNHYHAVLHMSNRITYKLRTCKCHQIINRSLSNVNQDHLLSRSRNMAQNPNYILIQMLNRFTHPLKSDYYYILAISVVLSLFNNLHPNSRKHLYQQQHTH